MDSKEQSTPDVFGTRNDPKREEQDRAYRVREAPDHLPPSLKDQINEHRQEQEKIREGIVKSIGETFSAQVDAEKKRLQRRYECDLERRFECDLDRQAVQEAQKDNRAQLKVFDRDGMREEWDMVLVYEMSDQSKSARPPQSPSRSQDEDRKPGRER